MAAASEVNAAHQRVEYLRTLQLDDLTDEACGTSEDTLLRRMINGIDVQVNGKYLFLSPSGYKQLWNPDSDTFRKKHDDGSWSSDTYHRSLVGWGYALEDSQERTVPYQSYALMDPRMKLGPDIHAIRQQAISTREGLAEQHARDLRTLLLTIDGMKAFVQEGRMLHFLGSKWNNLIEASPEGFICVDRNKRHYFPRVNGGFARQTYREISHYDFRFSVLVGPNTSKKTPDESFIGIINNTDDVYRAISENWRQCVVAARK